METLEVLPSSDSADKNHDGSKQPTGDWTFTGDDDVLSQDDFLHFSLSDVTASVDLPMASSIDDSGLEEMLQNGSMLQTKDASCTLAQLLTSTSPNAMPLTSVNQAYKMPVIPDSVMIEGEPFNNGVVLPSSGQMVSKHTLSTAGTLVQILQKGSSAATTQSTTSDFSLTFPSTSFTDKSTNNNNNNNNNNSKSEFSMASVTRTVNDSDRPDAMAIALAEDNGLFPNLEDNTMPLLNGEDSNISLDNGIEAMDMCSLLEQFEAVENFTSLSDDLLLSAPLDSSSIIKLKEDVDLLGQDQLQLFSPSNCQIIQNEENAETGQTPVMPSQVPAVASDSEVMKLLKAPHITVPRMARNRAAEQGIPKVAPAPRGDAMQKSKMRTKSKSTILLTDDAIPAMGNKTGSANTNMGKGSTIRKLLRGGVDSSLNSPGASPSRKPVKRLNLSQYRQRTKQQNIGGSEDSNDSCSSSTLEDNSHNINIGSNYFDVITDHDYCQNIPSCKGTAGDKTKKNVKNESCLPNDDPNCMLKSLLLNKNLSEELKEQAIKDRAVTQRNMRTASLLPSTSSSSSSPSSISSSSSVVSSVSENSKSSTSTSEAKPEKSCTQVSENHRDFGPVISETVEFDQVSQENQKLEQVSSEVPKSQEMSPDRQKSREVSPERPPSLHVSPEREKSQEIQPNMRDAPTISPEKLKSRRISPDGHKSRRISPDGHKSRRISPDGHKSRRISPEGQKLRRSSSDRRKLPRFDDKTDIVIDKLPSYCTALALEPIPGMKMKKSISVTNMIDTHIPCCDRDPSPERTGPVFDKVPAYFSCFTNSTKYDKLDPLKIDLDKEAYPWDKIRSDYSSNSSSRRQSPVFTVGDRLSRSSSSSSSLSRSRSPSVGRSWHHSGDRGSLSSPSQSSSSSSPSRSHSRSHSRSRRRRYRSRSRLRRSRSRSHHRSHSRSYRSHSRSHSRHRSRHHSRRRSKYRSRYRSRSRSRSRDRYWKKYREEMKVKREREKMQRIEERRIVYIGRIPNDMTKSLLRRTFEQFGDIEEVSVHFREHGDNYGFVTYKYTCDAYAAIERGNMLDGCENYELCFGGRREFCKTAYADLDGDKEDEEEMGSILGRSCKDLDFDTLLKQATKKIKKC